MILEYSSLQNDVNETPIFTPFPRHANLNNNLQTIDPSNNNGTTDKLLVKNTL